MSAIGISGLSKTYRGGTRALDRVSLTVEAGEMVALIGASGSGKSTLIRHISGLVPADKNSGSCKIVVDGAVVQEGGRISRNIATARTDIGVIFQQFNLVPRLSVLNNVLAGLLGRMPVMRGMLGLFHKEESQLAMQALDRVGIAHTARQRASTLSGGQQQRAAIARTLVQGARVILADEPIASLDPASAKRVMGILSQINQEDGITVLVSLHQVEYARRYCKRTVAMRDGQVVFDGPSRELTTQFLRDIYGEASEELVLPDADDFGTEPMTATA
ncbi:phosphonate ABC transporter ATP-binding protein [uncultured Roseibium sp.]|uniref:phosphonate ABC transporter ATP-binding protein n=1 Tax=uncultured Roseibium sp. TaxID=1936171 RepID=UPI002591A0B0|nr:phosphonate ABC transporter ATP-binding protein [uncultured Roseibium sp.]